MKIRFTFILITSTWVYSGHALTLTQAQMDGLQAELSANSEQRANAATAGYAQLIGFISDASVSGYVLDVNNSQGSKINIVKLPLDHELAVFDKMKLSIRGGFNYASVDSKNILEGISSDTVKPASEAYSGLVGLLLAVPLAEHWTLKPAIDVGVGRIENTIAFKGADAIQAKPLVDSLVVNWSSNMVLVSTGLGLDYTHAFENYRLDVKANYNHTLISSFSESGNFNGFSAQTDLLHFGVDLSRPWAMGLLGYPLTGVLHSDHTVFLGENSSALGFSNLSAFGYRLETDFSKENWYVSSAALGFNYLTGDKVEGYEVVFNLGF